MNNATFDLRTLVFSLIVAMLVPIASPAATPDGIVYVRVPRANSSIVLNESTYPKYEPGDEDYGKSMGASFLDVLPEVSYIHAGFNAPGQLVWRHANGTQTLLFDCLGNNPDNPGPPAQDEDTCVPMDPAVSYDGTKVAFSVYHGVYSTEQNLYYQRSGAVGHLYSPSMHSKWSNKSFWAGIYIYNLVTGELTAWPHQDRVFDTAPVWLPNGKIMFTSTRGPGYSAFVLGYYNGGKVQQLWIADADGGNAHNVDPHEQINALHPFVHSAGRVFYSSHQFNRVRVNHHTASNLWWLQSVDLRGGDLNAHLGAHRRNFELDGVQGVAVTALHFLAERSNGDLCADMYYRRNNFGAGKILCWPALAESRSPLGHEGPFPFRGPQGYYTAADGDSGDSGGAPDAPKAHFRDPAGLPGDQLLVAASIGSHAKCHWSSRSTMVKYTTNGLACDMGIYRSTEIPIRTSASTGYGLDDTTLVVNDPNWHEIMPKPVMPYSQIYGMNKPAQPPLSNTGDSNTSYGVFASTDAFVGDVRSEFGWQGPDSQRWCNTQGCSLHAVPLTDVVAMRFWKAPLNDRAYRGYDPLHNVWGQKLELLGDVPVQSDGSFKARLPADVPFLMAGVDALGRSIARHQQPMSLRPGEKQVCAGCHLHDPTDTDNDQHPFEDTLAAALPAVSPQLGDGELGVLEWKADIYTMLKDNCGSCHNGTPGSHPPNLVGVAGFDPGSDAAENVYRVLLNNDTPAYPPTDDNPSIKAEVPWYTRYVNVFFARESLLYWKAAGKRTDGRTDSQRDDDFNFGPAHPAHLTPAELKRLSDWIEAGSYMDQNADVDIIFRNGFDSGS